MKKTFVVSLLCAASLSLAALAGCASETASNSSNPTVTNSPTTQATPTAKMSPSSEMSSSDNPMVGGAPMLRTKDIIDNAVNSKDHTTLVAAVKAAGLVETLKGTGPFTVFAPTNAAFDKLPAGTVDTLLEPENKEKLKKILTYHVVAAKEDAASIVKKIEDGKGKATFKTVSGGTLTASKSGDVVTLTDEKGGASRVTIADVNQSNGVIHVVDTVLMPK